MHPIAHCAFMATLYRIDTVHVYSVQWTPDDTAYYYYDSQY